MAEKKFSLNRDIEDEAVKLDAESIITAFYRSIVDIYQNPFYQFVDVKTREIYVQSACQELFRRLKALPGFQYVAVEFEGALEPESKPAFEEMLFIEVAMQRGRIPKKDLPVAEQLILKVNVQ